MSEKTLKMSPSNESLEKVRLDRERAARAGSTPGDWSVSSRDPAVVECGDRVVGTFACARDAEWVVAARLALSREP